MISPKSKARIRGTTLVEILIAVALMLLIFLFLTADLIQSSQAQNLASNHTQTIRVANALLGVMKGDQDFWKSPDWSQGPQGGAETDPCLNAYPPYTDTMSVPSPSWHPVCAAAFTELAGAGVQAQYLWNAQVQAGDANVAQLTIWVMTNENGRNDVYELHETRANTAPAPVWSAVLPPASPTAPPTSPVPTTPPPSGTPTPKPSPTATPSKTPKPSPTPTGVFE